MRGLILLMTGYKEKSFSVFLSEKFNFTQTLLMLFSMLLHQAGAKMVNGFYKRHQRWFYFANGYFCTQVGAKGRMSRTLIDQLSSHYQQKAYHGEFSFLVNE